MEFPDLGKHCSVAMCHQLDFLPVKCDACDEIFCIKHFKYDDHKCSKSYTKNVQVPICPLCNAPVPTKRGQQPDIEVNEHIERDCKSDRAMSKRNTAYPYKCSLKGCKQREAMQITCNDCGLNYCLKHRHQTDHKCQKKISNGDVSSVRAKAANAAVQRLQLNQKNVNTKAKPIKTVNDMRVFQANYSEDEALAKALQQSMIDTKHSGSVKTDQSADRLSQERDDRMLAEAIAMSQRDANKNKDKCAVS